MKALVIYDSVFGNTEEIAHAVGRGLGSDVSVISVKNASPNDLRGVDILVVGSPTRSFSATPELLAFLQAIPEDGLKAVKAAAFDTRIDVKTIPFLFRGLVDKGGYAAPLIAKLLEQKGAALVVPPKAFFVKDREGPLRTGELDNAEVWGRSIVKQ